jgi:hypothetical protein
MTTSINDVDCIECIARLPQRERMSLPTLIPGLTINTGPDNAMAYTQLQLQHWTGSSWEQFGDVLSADGK